MLGRLSLSVGGARRSLAATPGGRSRMTVSGGASVARSELLAAAVVAAQASEEVCGAGGCAAAALWGCQSAAATHSLTASAGARRLPRLLQSTHAFQSSLSSNVYAVSHGIRSPKARVAGSSSTRLFAPSSNITAREHPSQRACVRPSVIGAAWKLHAHREEPKAGRARRAPTQTSEAATRRRRDDSEQTTYKQEG